MEQGDLMSSSPRWRTNDFAYHITDTALPPDINTSVKTYISFLQTRHHDRIAVVLPREVPNVYPTRKG